MQEGNQINLNDQGKLPEFSDVCKKRHHKQASKQPFCLLTELSSVLYMMICHGCLRLSKRSTIQLAYSLTRLLAY
jgi:hypothetical protein